MRGIWSRVQVGLSPTEREADAQARGDPLDEIEMGIKLAFGVMQRGKRRARQLELAAGLQRDRPAALSSASPIRWPRSSIGCQPSASRTPFSKASMPVRPA
jgi:hypothetical protein